MMRMTMLGGAAVLTMMGAAGPVGAQTAGDINRLNAAIQICNSPAGTGMAECAKLRGRLGATGLGGGGLGGSGLGAGGTMGAVGGLLGALGSARAATAPVAQPQANTAAVQQDVAGCVRNAAGDATAIQACLTSASARAAVPAPSMRPGLGIGAYQAPAYRAPAGDTATAIHQAGQSYQACAAANPTNWRSCLPLLNGGAR